MQNSQLQSSQTTDFRPSVRVRQPLEVVGAQHEPDPIFAAIRALDRAASRWSIAFSAWLDLMDGLDPHGRYCWDDSAAVARAVLGPLAESTLSALAATEARLQALTPARYTAEDRFATTKPTSEIGIAAYKAAARRFARRTGFQDWEEAILLKGLASMLAA